MSQTLRCNFCGKSKDQVPKFIAGPGVYICNECIDLCVEILAEDRVDWPPFEEYVTRYLVPSLVESGLALRSLTEWRRDESERQRTIPPASTQSAVADPSAESSLNG